ncbi:hypothetical protein HPB47_019119 [Ixodes persulcatus]|uniref:Uncharacterized protein n=1 Tax=Ixodes persulcatus TaxID=34615 RepID=A0AC60QJ29_IXOPE|nr:hypothetical protein HPB47_019119 [Ixodes persulcatus]
MSENVTGTDSSKDLRPEGDIFRFSGGTRQLGAPRPLSLLPTGAGNDWNPFSVLPDNASGPHENPAPEDSNHGELTSAVLYSAKLKSNAPPDTKKRRTGTMNTAGGRSVNAASHEAARRMATWANIESIANPADADEDGWTPVTQRRRKVRTTNYTVILRPKQPIRMAALSPKLFIDAVRSEASKIRVTTGFKARVLHRSNTIAIDTSNPQLRDHLLKVESFPFGGETPILVQTYEPARRENARGVIHGVDESNAQTLQRMITCPPHRVLSARPMGSSGSILITFDGPTLPSHVLYDILEKRVFEYKPKVVVCSQCHDIGHKHDICPNQHRQRCEKCGRMKHGDDECNGETPECRNCKGSHIATDSCCPAARKATQNLRSKLQPPGTPPKHVPSRNTRPSRSRRRRRRHQKSTNAGNGSANTVAQQVAPKTPSPDQALTRRPKRPKDTNSKATTIAPASAAGPASTGIKSSAGGQPGEPRTSETPGTDQMETDFPPLPTRSAPQAEPNTDALVAAMRKNIGHNRKLPTTEPTTPAHREMTSSETPRLDEETLSVIREEIRRALAEAWPRFAEGFKNLISETIAQCLTPTVAPK